MKAIRKYKTTAYRQLQRNRIHVNTLPFVFILSLLLNACQKEAIEPLTSKIINTDQRACVELVCSPSAETSAHASVETDGNLFWVSVDLIKACDATVITEQIAIGDTLYFNFSVKTAVAGNCSCKSKYRYECKTGSSVTNIAISVRDGEGEVIFKKTEPLKR